MPAKSTNRKKKRSDTRTAGSLGGKEHTGRNMAEPAESAIVPHADDLDLEIAELEDVSARVEPPPEEEETLELPAAQSSPAKPAPGKAKSPYFQSPPTPKKRRPAANTVSALPIPPLSAPAFGLIQESLADEPFRLLIAVTFLIKTSGRAAIPAFRQLVERYPTPEALAAAAPDDIVPDIRHLGLAVVRYAAVRRYARRWLARPPSRDARFAVKNYPLPGDGADVRAGQEFGPEDDGDEASLSLLARGRGTAWEIGHLTQGRYALDSWRIFCRDVLLGKAADWKGGGREAEFQPEVRPSLCRTDRVSPPTFPRRRRV